MNVNRTYYALLPLTENKPLLREGKIKIYKTLIRPVQQTERNLGIA